MRKGRAAGQDNVGRASAVKLRTAARFRDALEAHLAKGALAAEGIDAVVFDEHVVGVNWLYSDAIGGVKLAVTPGNVAPATLILRRHHEESSVAAETVRRLRLHQVAGIAVLLVMAATLIPALVLAIPFFVRGRWRGRRTAGSSRTYSQ